MVLDGISTIALVGNIIQFIDFGTKILKNTCELYQSVDGVIWRSLREALKSQWKEGDIQKLEARLMRYRSEISLRFMRILRRLEMVREKQIADLRDDLETCRKQLCKELVSKSDLFTVSKTLTSFIATSSHLQIEQNILESLRFPQMRERYAAIPEAHTKTFEWILENFPGPDPSRPRVRFIEWLEDTNVSNSGIYWVAGKPGSGKSTLMKYICDNPRTETALHNWSSGKALMTASFFFWHYVTRKQKSLEGLLQTLLYEILKRFPDTISLAVPMRWNNSVQDPWTRSELLQALHDLKGGLKTSTCCCFFIDGLDEYTGNPGEVLEVINVLASMKNTKICVASRPWPIFQTSLGGNENRTLHVQDLTKDDIAVYVQTRLAEDPVFVAASRLDKRYVGLVSEIVDKSQGVFLWVFLVIRSLLEGITNEDTMKSLQRRLRMMPKDLDEFFKHILDDIDEVYQVQMARTILISLLGDKPHFLLIYWFLDELEENPNRVLDMPVYKRMRSSVFVMQSKMETRLAARTKGLLEVQKTQYIGFNMRKVTFLHRTVADFLRHYAVQGFFDRLAGPSFHPETSMCHVVLGLLKLVPRTYISRDTLKELALDIIGNAHRVELDLASPLTELLDQLENIVSHDESSEPRPNESMLYPVNSMLPIDDIWFLSSTSAVVEVSAPIQQRSWTFLDLCVQGNLCLYVAEKIASNPSSVLSSHHPPLLSRIRTGRQGFASHDTAAMACTLLDAGVDPSAPCIFKSSTTVWSQIFTQIQDTIQGIDARDPKLDPYSSAETSCRKIACMMLEKGADPNGAEWTSLVDLRDRLVGDPALSFRLRLIELFLMRGARVDSNRWGKFIQGLHVRRKVNISTRHSLAAQEVKLFVEYGADPDIQVLGIRRGQNTGISLDQVIGEIFHPKDQEELLSLLQTCRKKVSTFSSIRRWVISWIPYQALATTPQDKPWL
ncbi:hypothetical protein SLS60_005820 [Paraconiothyrium brasiliense]|uniref:NACHT domain-containing protein n=1 Tax=Paraconiothyrium brasiliense TaxID=300254 RepID=A0ABR3RDA6_9PLEO